MKGPRRGGTTELARSVCWWSAWEPRGPDPGTPEKGSASPQALRAGKRQRASGSVGPASSTVRGGPGPARPHSPEDPEPPLLAGNAGHAALHRSAPRGLPRATSGDALDHREASILSGA